MQTNGQTTVEVLLKQVPGLIVVPRLFEEPREGYLAWATELAKIDEEIRPDTVSGRLIAATGPAWYYGLLLPRIISGDYEQQLSDVVTEPVPDTIEALEQYGRSTLTPRGRLAAARLARLRFEAGQPLYIGPYDSIERYKATPATLTYQGNHRYLAGHLAQQLQAASHTEALNKARMIYLKARTVEIEAAKKAAADFAEKTPRMILDVLSAILREDKALYDTDGDRIAWENGAHGMYGVQGIDWCYLMNCGSDKAAQLAALAQQQAIKTGQNIRLAARVKGTLPRYFGLEDWRRTKKGIDWAGGQWRPLNGDASRGTVSEVEGRPVCVCEVQPGNSERFNWIGRVYGPKKELLIESPAPATWELEQDDVMAWAAWAGLQLERRRRKGGES